MDNVRLIAAATGASGVPYFLRMLKHLENVNGRSDLILSPGFLKVAEKESSETIVPENLEGTKGLHRFRLLDHANTGAEPASGSAQYSAMIILPASMNTVAAIAAGLSTNLIERAADVSLKERRPLVLVPREAPYSLTHLKNFTTITEAGGIVIPASPGFYHNPKTIEDILDFVIDRVFQHARVPLRLLDSWKG